MNDLLHKVVRSVLDDPAGETAGTGGRLVLQQVNPASLTYRTLLDRADIAQRGVQRFDDDAGLRAAFPLQLVNIVALGFFLEDNGALNEALQVFGCFFIHFGRVYVDACR